MEFIKRIWKLKQTKIVLIIFVIIGILAAAFFLAPGGGKRPTQTLGTETGSTGQSSTADSQASADSESTIGVSSVESGTVSGKDNPSSKAQRPGNSSAATSSKTGSVVSKDKYQTDPVPEGKPKPQESEDVSVDESKKLTCTLTIRCDTILDNMDKLRDGKETIVPKDGIILDTITVTFSEGESVFDVLKRVTRQQRIHMEFSNTPLYNSAYIEGIHNLYEFDCGNLSGWMYQVNDWFPNYGCSRYILKNGDKIEWLYTCDLGADIGGGYAVGQGQ